MVDTKSEELADLILDYSISLKKGDRLMIQFDPTYTYYANMIAEKARKKGAKVRYDSISIDPIVLREFLKRENKFEWGQELERRKEISKWCNARILIDCESRTNYAEGLADSEKKVAEFEGAVVGPYKDVLYRQGKDGHFIVKWNITAFPGSENAKQAGMSLPNYRKFLYDATLGCNWGKMREQMGRIKDALDDTKDLHIIVPGLTDLHMSLVGRGGGTSEGKWNLPDGEVFYGPVEDSLNGYIFFQGPAKREGVGLLNGIKLEFEKGVVIKYSTNKNQSYLKNALKIKGANSVGEFGIGLNYGIKEKVFNILFDEKIGGTIHLALGSSLEEPLDCGGGLNKADVHWDIVCDLRKNSKDLKRYPGGKIYADKRLVHEDGVWKV